jgi:hypothetical protein
MLDDTLTMAREGLGEGTRGNRGLFEGMGSGMSATPVVLTSDGEACALRLALEGSMVARVALQGYDGSWPIAHVETAIKTCNEFGARRVRAEASDNA